MEGSSGPEGSADGASRSGSFSIDTVNRAYEMGLRDGSAATITALTDFVADLGPDADTASIVASFRAMDVRTHNVLADVNAR